MRSTDFLFPRFSRRKSGSMVPIGTKVVFYSTSVAQLKNTCSKWGLDLLNMYSSRRSVAMEASQAEVSRDYIKKCGNLSYNCVDEYIHLKEPWVLSNDKILKKF